MQPNDLSVPATLETHWTSIYQLGLRMFGNSTAAEEMAQQMFFRACFAWDQFQGRSHIKTWLFRIGINVCRKQLRDRNRFQESDLDAAKRQKVLPDGMAGKSLRNPAPLRRSKRIQTPARRLCLAVLS